MEFIEVAKRPKFKKYFSSSDLETLLVSLSSRAIFIEVVNSVNIAPDPKDNFLLDLAMEGNATHLITGDKDLLSLKNFEKTKIVTLRNYLSSK